MKKAPICFIETKTIKGKTATIAVKVKNFKDIVATRAKIIYDPAILTLSKPPILVPVGKTSVAMNTSKAGEIVIAWFCFPEGKMVDGVQVIDSNAITLKNNATLFKLYFKRLGSGSSVIAFLDDQGENACSSRNAPNELMDDKPFEEHYLPGKLTFV